MVLLFRSLHRQQLWQSLASAGFYVKAALSLSADTLLPERGGRIMMSAIIFTIYIGIRTPKTLARRVWAARIFVKSGLMDLVFILFFLLSEALAALADMDALIAFVNMIYIPPLVGLIFLFLRFSFPSLRCVL